MIDDVTAVATYTDGAHYASDPRDSEPPEPDEPTTCADCGAERDEDGYCTVPRCPQSWDSQERASQMSDEEREYLADGTPRWPDRPLTHGRERGDDDGVEYSDPRDARDGGED